MATAGVLAKESALAVLGLILVLELIWWTPRPAHVLLGTTAALCAVPLAAWAVHRSAVLAAGKAAGSRLPITRLSAPRSGRAASRPCS